MQEVQFSIGKSTADYSLMDIEDTESLKAEETQAKREHILHSNQQEKHQNMQSPQSQECIDILSQANQQDRGHFKFQRREVSEKATRTVDLNKLIFSGIVRHCRNEDLISEELAHYFYINYTTKIQQHYIECFRSNQLHRFNFARSKINIIDHRRLTEMLVHHNKLKYTPIRPEGPYDFLKDARDFLRDIYAMPSDQYQRMIDQQVNRYYQTWWGGPENLNPLPDTPVEVLDVEEEDKKRREADKLLGLERLQHDKKMLERVNEKCTTSDDLKDIANRLSSQLFGRLMQTEPDLKYEAMEEEDRESSSSKKKKHKSDKKGKKEKKSKKKKSKTEAEIKKEWMQEKAKKEVLQEDEMNQNSQTKAQQGREV